MKILMTSARSFGVVGFKTSVATHNVVLSAVSQQQTLNSAASFYLIKAIDQGSDVGSAFGGLVFYRTIQAQDTPLR